MGFDIDEYLARVGYSGSRAACLQTLHALTAAHSQAIPFENLDVLLGRPVELDVDRLFDKLVRARRGGYCFEQNGLFLHVLQSLGFAVTPLSARVRIQRARDELPARTHLCLRVELEGDSWLTDVGVGGLSLTAAIRLVLDAEQQTPHEPRRLVHEQGRYFHQVRFADGWHDVYELTLEEMPRIDREVANWYTSAHPRSHFKSGLTVARAAPDGARITLANGELTLRRRDGSAQRRQLTSRQALREVLSEQFGLVLDTLPVIAGLDATADGQEVDSSPRGR